MQTQLRRTLWITERCSPVPRPQQIFGVSPCRSLRFSPSSATRCCCARALKPAVQRPFIRALQLLPCSSLAPPQRGPPQPLTAGWDAASGRLPEFIDDAAHVVRAGVFYQIRTCMLEVQVWIAFVIGCPALRRLLLSSTPFCCLVLRSCRRIAAHVTWAAVVRRWCCGAKFNLFRFAVARGSLLVLCGSKSDSPLLDRLVAGYLGMPVP